MVMTKQAAILQTAYGKELPLGAEKLSFQSQGTEYRQWSAWVWKKTLNSTWGHSLTIEQRPSKKYSTSDPQKLWENKCVLF